MVSLAWPSTLLAEAEIYHDNLREGRGRKEAMSRKET